MGLPAKKSDKLADRSPVLTLRDEVNRLFEDFFTGGSVLSRSEWVPALDLSETDNQVIVKVEVPGMDPKDIDISLTSDTLTIKGEKKEETRKKEENYSRVECRYGAFERTVTLPASVDQAKVNATVKNGVLKITLDKKEGSRSRTIQVKSE